MPYRPDAPHFVYRLDFADGWSYVGITSRSVETRIQEHLGLLHMDGWCGHHDRAVRLRRGWGTQGIMARHVAMGYSWTWTVLAEGLSLQAALKREDEEIERIDRPLHRRTTGRAALRQRAKMWHDGRQR